MFSDNYFIMTKAIHDLFIQSPLKSGGGDITFKEVNTISEYWT